MKAAVRRGWHYNTWADGSKRSYAELPTSFTASFSSDESLLRRAGANQDVFIEGGTTVGTDGQQWSNLKTVSGRVHCASNVATGFADNMACLDRSLIIIPDKQFVQGTIYVSGSAGSITDTQEMEFFGRFKILPNVMRGYEIDISRDSGAIFIVKHGITTGAVGDFTILSSVGSISVTNSTVFRAEFENIGSDVRITVFRAGVQVIQTTDTNPGANYTSGNCGIAGLMRADNVLDYGLSAWSCGTF